MGVQDENIAGNGDDQQSDDQAWLIKSIAENDNRLPPSLTPRIPRVPMSMLTETRDYNKYYVPKVVSMGPYHYGKPDLKFVENLKPDFAKKLLSTNSPVFLPNGLVDWKIHLTILYNKLGEPTMVQRLRNFYQENSTDGFSDKDFTKMMILDACFILYYIRYIFRREVDKTCPLNNHQILSIHQDLFLLENQIPLQVLTEVMDLVKFDRLIEFKPFIHVNFLTSRNLKRGWFFAGHQQKPIQEVEADHLLQFLHHILTAIKPRSYHATDDIYRCTLRNANELIDVGINFKPSGLKQLTHIGFSKRWWLFSAELELPSIIVDDSTKSMLLNLIAHEKCSDDDGREAWVTSYVCLLDSLIDQPEDVAALRKAGVLYNSLGSDNEVAKLLNEIRTDLKPNFAAYSEVKNKIENHYESLRNTTLTQLKHDYMRSPWAFAFLGALIALLLSALQTYFTIWSPEGECDHLCKFLKINHHL